MLILQQPGLGLHATGMNYVMVNALPWGTGQLSLLAGASPAVVNGDKMIAPPRTTPDAYPLTITSTGVPVIQSGGDTSGQNFPFDVYDWSLRKWYGQVQEYVNNHAPLMLDTQPHTIPLTLGLDMAPLDMTTFVVDQEGDPLVVTTPDTPPSGLSYVGNILSGIPDTPGAYPMHFTATDPAGGAVVYPLFTFVVGNTAAAIVDQTLTIFKVKSGIQGPPGTGSDPVVVNLAPPSFMVFCYAEGTPVDPSFAGANGLLTVFKGGLDDTANATLSATGTGCTGTINTANDTPVVGQIKGYFRVTGMTADNATLNLTVVDSGVTIIAKFVVTKLRTGYEIVAVLPTSNLFDGRMVYLTTDGKLYRYKAGTGWTAAVAATDVTGQLTDSQLAAIAAAKVTGQITATQITDGSITTPKLAAGSVTSAVIAAGTITAADIAADTITASNIAAGAITSNELAANAVIANNISAGAITAAKLAASNVVTATAQIGDLIVTTIKIAGDSVSNAAQVYLYQLDDINVDALGYTGGAPNNTWYDLSGATLAYTGTGGRIMCNVHVAVPGNTAGATADYIQFRLIRDSATVVGQGKVQTCVLINQWSGIMGWYTGFYFDTPPAGTHTYKLQYNCYSSREAGIQPRADVRERGIQLQELKR